MSAPTKPPTKSLLDLQLVALQTMMVAAAESWQFWLRASQECMRELGLAAPAPRAQDGIAREPLLVGRPGRRPRHDVGAQRKV